MLALRIGLAAVLFAAAPASAQAQPLPPSAGSAAHHPPQTSAARAILYSAAATGAFAAVGALVCLADAGAGVGVLVAGGLMGPMAGNLSLGADDAVATSMRTKAAGMGTGVALVGTGGLVAVFGAVGCGGGECDGPTFASTLVVGGAVVIGATLVAGAVYDLATIPANARRAAGNRVPAEAPRITAVPSYDARHEAPMLKLRVGL